jgi:hypothetical protein
MIVTIEEDIYGNLVLPLPTELYLNWEIGDTIEWIEHGSGYLIRNHSWEERTRLRMQHPE